MSSSSSSSKKRYRPQDEYEDIEDSSEKRMRILQDILDTNIAMDEEKSVNGDDEELDYKPIRYEELRQDEYSEDCYGCTHMNNDAIQENEKYYYMMKLYTENVSTSSKEAIFRMIKDYYDEYCKEDTGEDWTIESIREHFDKHTNFPTDELNKQIAINKKIRDITLSCIMWKRGEDVKLMNKNLRDLLALNKDTRELMMLKGRINTMTGYCEKLNY